jgi:carbon-monoxide dehydrogenase large subunit
MWITIRFPPVADPRDAALAGSALARRDLTSNVVSTYRVAYGDTEAAFRIAAHIIREDYYQHRGGAHSLEGRGGVAEYQPGADGITYWASTQKAHDLHQNISAFVRIDENRFRVTAPDIGGGFGPSSASIPRMWPSSPLEAAEALAEMGEDRREHFIAAVQERDQFGRSNWRWMTAARILAIRGRLHSRSRRLCAAGRQPSLQFGVRRAGPLPCARARHGCAVVHTNKVPCVIGARRRLSASRLRHGAAARQSGTRAQTGRERNPPPQSDSAGANAVREPAESALRRAILYDSGDYPGTQAQVMKRARMGRLSRAGNKRHGKAGRYLGIGLAHGLKGTGTRTFDDGAGARRRQRPASRCLRRVGPWDRGSQLRWRKLPPAELGVPPQDVTVVAGDSAVVPVGLWRLRQPANGSQRKFRHASPHARWRAKPRRSPAC